MTAKEIHDIFISILRSELTETKLDTSIKEKLTPEVLAELYVLSKKQDLAHIVSSCIVKNKIKVNNELMSRFAKEEMLSVYRYEQLKYTYGEICKIFEEANIPYVPLKGSVIRPYYPKESMRTSCDIDILVKIEQLDDAVKMLEKHEYKVELHNYHDISIFSPSGIHLELHFSILENMENIDAVLKDAWEYTVAAESYKWEFSKEFFAYHMFAHMSYHFKNGGCGIKSLMDIWVLEHKMGITNENCKDLLEKAGIYTFASQISDIANICFSGKETNDLAKTVLSYIFSGGVYGTTENKVTLKKDNIFVYAVKRVCLPYKDMVTIFPVLKKAPFLMPFCWIMRPFKLLNPNKAKTAMKEMKIAGNVSKDDTKAMRLMFERLEI